MTKEEFKKQYCKKSRMTVRGFDKDFVIMECPCEAKDCPKFIVLSKAKGAVKRYERLYKIKN